MIVPANPRIGSIHSAFDSAPATSSETLLISISAPPTSSTMLYDSIETPSASGGLPCGPAHIPSPLKSVHPQEFTPICERSTSFETPNPPTGTAATPSAAFGPII